MLQLDFVAKETIRTKKEMWYNKNLYFQTERRKFPCSNSEDRISIGCFRGDIRKWNSSTQ